MNSLASGRIPISYLIYTQDGLVASADITRSYTIETATRYGQSSFLNIVMNSDKKTIDSMVNAKDLTMRIAYRLSGTLDYKISIDTLSKLSQLKYLTSQMLY